MELACRSLDERGFAVAFVQFLDRAIALGIPNAGANRDEVSTQLGVYREALEDLPADLVVWAFKGIWKDWRYQSLPKPGDVRALIGTKASRRKDALSKAKWAKSLSERMRLPVGLLAVEEASRGAGPRSLSAETQAMLDAAKKPKPGVFSLKPKGAERETRSGDLAVGPRPDLVKRWAIELGMPLD